MQFAKSGLREGFLSRFQPGLMAIACLSGLVFASCGSSPVPSASMSSSIEAMPSQAAKEAPASDALSNQASNQTSNQAALMANAQPPQALNAQAKRSLPQLIKTAELSLTVDSMEKSIDAATKIVRQQQGDVMGLDDQTSPTEGDRRTASLILRVPQDKLEATLDALAKLGTAQRRSIKAEDVSSQLVDFEARLRNLRRTEQTLLDIMKQSGSVGDVLKVAQELSQVRTSIEQLDAQVKDLRDRVAFSTITLSLEAAIATNPLQQAVGLQIRETWTGATHSLSVFSVGLLRLGIWLLVYSPYWLLIGGVILISYRRLGSRAR